MSRDKVALTNLCSVAWVLAVDWERQVEEVDRLEGPSSAVFEGLETVWACV